MTDLPPDACAHAPGDAKVVFSILERRSAVLRRLRPWQWVRGGILAVLAIVAAVLTVVDPHPGSADQDPSGPATPAAHSAWTQLPSANDNCAGADPGNPMRVLVGGDNPDECAGGGVWTPAQQAVFLGTGVAPSGH